VTELAKPQVEKGRHVDISVVLPVHNEAGALERLHQELRGVLREMKASWEIIFVDDGSTDGSSNVLRTLCGNGTRAVLLGRNFGQTAALAAGIDNARGSIIVTMDADGQNDPADIPRMVALLGEGYGVVSGWRIRRKDPLVTRRFPSWAANKVISLVTGVKLHDYGCALKAYDRKVFEHLRLYGEMHRFIPALASWTGAEVAEVKVNHRPRAAGRSNYGLSRVVRVVLDLVTVKFLLSYATRPIQMFGRLGFWCFAGTALSLLYVIYDKLAHRHDMTGNPLFFLSVLLMVVGTQFITLGLLGEITIRTYHESQGKPIYIVKETIG